MAIKDALLPEFDHEMGTTRRVLERVPDADLQWTPHQKSFNLGRLAAHIANIPHWMNVTCDTSEFDVASQADDVRPKDPPSTAWILQTFDENVKNARAKLAEQTDAMLMATWSLKQGTHQIFTMPKAAVLRSFVLSHLIHHRGQLTVYLRLRDVPLPSVYGPTADEG